MTSDKVARFVTAKVQAGSLVTSQSVDPYPWASLGMTKRS